MPFKNLERLLPLLLLPLLLAGCDPQEEVATTHVVGPPRPGSWLSVHKTPPSAPTGAAAIGSPGKAKALFVDMARQAGLDYRWSIPGPRPLDILQTIGNGCAFLDYDNSGCLSVLLVGTDHLALYKGDGRGHFTDVSHATGLDKLRGHFLGCAVGDYDNDGFEDLYISGYRTGLLLHNDGGKRFTDVTKEAGLKPQPWGTSAAFAETTPGSGRLDLYVGDYLQFDPKTSRRLCQKDAQWVACSPAEYAPEHGVFYQNGGGGRFRDATREWNAQDGRGKTLGVAFADFNGSGRPSLYLANDEEQGDLFENQGKAFRNQGAASGAAFDERLTIHAGMGTDWGDYDNDGRLDLFAAAFQREPKSIFHNEGSGLLQDRSTGLLLATPTLPYVAFGGKWLDYDNDGWLDLMITNGHVYDNIASVDKTAAYREPTQLFRNDRGRLLVDMSARAGADLPRAVVGRGLATGDYDNDGRVDALVVDSEGSPLLLRNESKPVGHWLSFKLVGTRSNRDGIGALVTVTAGGLTQTRLCHTDGSYLSASDLRVHVGLGEAAVAERVTVRWPSGQVDVLHTVKADRFLTVREGGK
jgi:hypothetical protein